MNINWPRWIFASLSKHFYDYATTHSLPMLIEGQDKQQNSYGGYAEFRFDGPEISEISRNYWDITATVNILVVSYINEEDLHRLHRITGTVVSAFTCIPIMKYGDGEDDNSTSEVGIMNHDEIVIMQYGQVLPDSRLLQSTVESEYKMQITVRD